MRLILSRPLRSGFTIMELMVTLATLGILASTAIPAFLNHQSRARTVEAIHSLGKMVEGEVAYHTREKAFIEAGPTGLPPTDLKRNLDFSVDTRWQSLSFGFQGPLYYGFQAVIPDPTQVYCEAIGDLNGDGTTSLFRRVVMVTAQGQPEPLGDLFIFDELE